MLVSKAIIHHVRVCLLLWPRRETASHVHLLSSDFVETGLVGLLLLCCLTAGCTLSQRGALLLIFLGLFEGGQVVEVGPLDLVLAAVALADVVEVAPEELVVRLLPHRQLLKVL